MKTNRPVHYCDMLDCDIYRVQQDQTLPTGVHFNANVVIDGKLTKINGFACNIGHIEQAVLDLIRF